MGPKAEADLVQIIEELKSRCKIGKTILCGGSMGGSSSLTFAAMHPELIDGVVSMNGTANHLEYENFQDAIQESFGGTKAQIPLEYKNRSAEYWPERLTMPIAITAGGKDTIVPPQSVLRLAGVLKKLQPNVLLIYREEGGHSTNYDDAKQAFDFVLDKALQSPSKIVPAKRSQKVSRRPAGGEIPPRCGRSRRHPSPRRRAGPVRQPRRCAISGSINPATRIICITMPPVRKAGSAPWPRARICVHWTKKGPVLDLGKPGEDDSASASYGTTYFDGTAWHMFYLGTPHTSPRPISSPCSPTNTGN